MPIDIETFESESPDDLTERTNPEKVIHFLVANRDRAFTPAEIADGADVKHTSIHTVLARLEDRDLVRQKGDYYALGDPELVRNAYDVHATMQGLDDRYGEEDLGEWRAHATDDE